MKYIQPVSIGNYTIGPGHPPFIIAEIGVNHNGDREAARTMIRAAKRAGAHAAKLQSFRADSIADRYLIEKKDIEGITGGSKSAYDMYKALEISDEAHMELFSYALDEDIVLLTSVFDEKTADFIDACGVPAFKIASSDLTHLPLIHHVAKKGKPVILSTGMGTLREVEDAVETCYKAGNTDIVLLHCVSSYPPPDSDINLLSVRTLQEHFPHPVGYSDHCEGMTACFVACCLGAMVIEKHFTLDVDWHGPDQRISATSDQLKWFIDDVAHLKVLLGDGIKRPGVSEQEGVVPSRRSLRIKGTIRQGEVITEDKIIALKPEIGIKPAYIRDVVGRKARVSMGNHEPITWDKIE
ncbi:MAG: N-acetylneuraminate synthase family protein [Candidatus Auribacterota bacterium]